MSLIKFVNCRLIRNGRIECDDIWVRDGKIMNPEKIFFEEKVKADKSVDCNNAIIAPGYIDVQINGSSSIRMYVRLYNCVMRSCRGVRC